MKAKHLLLGTLVLGLLPSHLAAQNTVTPPHRRQEMLDEVKRVLSPEPVQWPIAEIARVNPFRPVETAQEIVAVQVDPRDTRPRTSVTTVPVGPQRLSDAEAIATIARSLRPTGSMVSSRGHVLLLPGGNWREGSTRPVNVGEFRYEITLEEVTEDGYVLRVGESVLTRRFNDNTLNASSSLRTNSSGD